MQKRRTNFENFAQSKQKAGIERRRREVQTRNVLTLEVRICTFLYSVERWRQWAPFRARQGKVLSRLITFLHSHTRRHTVDERVRDLTAHCTPATDALDYNIF